MGANAVDDVTAVNAVEIRRTTTNKGYCKLP